MSDRAARAEAEPSATEEIKVTPEMIEAGTGAFFEWDDPVFHEPDSIVRAIYRSMEAQRRASFRRQVV
jgi:hypothetical protein